MKCNGCKNYKVYYFDTSLILIMIIFTYFLIVNYFIMFWSSSCEKKETPP